jgi:uncharacterized repeat protein (TIGR01451 family)
VPANNVTITDTTPSGISTFSNLTVSRGFSGTATSLTLNQSLAAGQSVTITFQATVTATSSVTITNTASATSSNANSVQASASVFVQPIDQNTILSIVKDVRNLTTNSGFANSATVTTGQTVEYQIRVTNTGTVPAQNVVITDSTPSGANRTGSTSVSLSSTGDIASGVTLASPLAPNQSVTITFQATITATGPTTITNTATARANNASQVSDTAQVIISQPQPNNTTLSIVKQVRNVTQNTGLSDFVSARNNDVMQYQIQVTNTGSVPANNVVITDTNPGGLSTFTNQSVSVGSSGTITSGISLSQSLAVGQSITITYQATVTRTTAGTITNTATASASNAPTVSDTAQVNVVDAQRATLSLQKTVRNSSSGNFTFGKTVDANNGETVEFRLAVSNIGSVSAQQLVVSDVIPSGLSFQSGSVTSDRGTVNDNLNSSNGVTLGDLAAGNTVTIFFRATVNQNFNGTITNIARARANNADEVTSNALVNVFSISNGNLSITKLVRSIDNSTGFQKSITVNDNERVEYQIRVTANNGTVRNVTLFEDLPSNLNFVGGSVRVDGVFTGDNLFNQTLTLGDLTNGESVTITFQAIARTFSGGGQNIIVNTARANGTNVGQVSDTATVIVRGSNNTFGQLAIIKSVRNTTTATGFQNSVNASNGDRVQFEIVVSNAGNQTLNNVRVADTLQNGLDIDENSIRLDGSFVNTGNSPDVFLGSLFVGQQRRIIFDAVVTANFQTTIQNLARATADNTSSVQDDAFVLVNTTTQASNLFFGKRAFNDTKNADAQTVPANREDFITYTLTVTNNGSGPATNFVITDDLSGVVPFADLVPDGTVIHSGTTVSFPAVTIPAGSSVSRSFRVRVKFGLPATQSFVMTNTYGNSVSITIPGQTQFVAPKTGSGTTSAITFSGIMTAGFMIWRKRKTLFDLIFV